MERLNPENPYPEITELIGRDVENVSDEPLGSFRLIRVKQGVYVYRCLFGGTPAVVKYFENEGDRREIRNYHILMERDIPTIKTFALGNSAIVMEDLSLSEDWRLGVEEDLADAQVAQCLAHWYFGFHEKGASISELDALYFESDGITGENLEMLIERLPEAAELFTFILSRLDRLREWLYKPPFTLTYNDFYWTNLVVRKNKSAAMMFDYNLLGKGYRYSDFRNLRSLEEGAYQAFSDEYAWLYMQKHGRTRMEEEQLEIRIDDVAAPLFSLISAYGRKDFPHWAETAKNEALDGSLLLKARHLLCK